MAQRTDIFDLGRLSLHSGEGRRIDTHVTLDPLSFGGQTYATGEHEVPVRLDVSRTMHGYSLRLRFSVPLEGPCMRCLEAAESTIDVDAREVDQLGSGDDDELTSPYVSRDELDLRSWARDALALALPTQIVCTADCLGLCAICGENLNTAPDHAHESEPDPRWAALRELKFE
ncbi:MAG TPA: DUF177 domain-containing protein [Thermoleophilaceae bacterium]|jgi:uncharacterized protein